jgi:hypothetical protein
VWDESSTLALKTTQTAKKIAPLTEFERADLLFIEFSFFEAPAPAGRNVYRMQRSHFPSSVGSDIRQMLLLTELK